MPGGFSGAKAIAGVARESFPAAVIRRFRDAEGSEAVAAISYRLAVALFPFLIFMTATVAAGLQLFGGEEPAERAIDQVDAFVSEEFARDAERQLRQVADSPTFVPLMGGLVATVWTALSGGRSVIRHLNAIHGLREHRSRLRLAVAALAVSLGSSLAAVMAVLVLLVGTVDPGRAAAGLGMDESLGFLVEMLCWPVGLALLTLAASVAYGIAPAREGDAFAITLGALLFGVLWTVSSGLLVLYIENVGAFARTYGALTGVVALLAWVYLTSLAFVTGAVVDAELESRRG
jgi:membrane protein